MIRRLSRKKAHRPLKPAAPVRWAGMVPDSQPRVELIWRDESGAVHHHRKPWARATVSDEALRDWILEYFEKVQDGYRPAGFTDPPMPHCARITIGVRVAAEWISSKARTSAESLVTAADTGTSGGSLASASAKTISPTLRKITSGLPAQGLASYSSERTAANDGVMSGSGCPSS